MPRNFRSFLRQWSVTWHKLSRVLKNAMLLNCHLKSDFVLLLPRFWHKTHSGHRWFREFSVNDHTWKWNSKYAQPPRRVLHASSWSCRVVLSKIIALFGLLSAWWSNILMNIFPLHPKLVQIPYSTAPWDSRHHPKQMAVQPVFAIHRQPGRLPDHDWPNPREVAGHPWLVEGYHCGFSRNQDEPRISGHER